MDVRRVRMVVDDAGVAVNVRVLAADRWFVCVVVMAVVVTMQVIVLERLVRVFVAVVLARVAVSYTHLTLPTNREV